MILLTGHSLNRARKVPLEALSLSLKERESTATMTPADMSGIGTESWLLDDTEPGAGIVWRVKSIGTAYATNTPTVQLEHVISTLKDRILFGEVTPATITGNAKAETCTARQAVEYILRRQGDWTMGAFEYSVSNAYKFDGDTLFDALETVTHTLADAEWTYDLTRYPFRLNITRRSGEVGSELRCGRNLRTITRNIDRSGMYTRFYPIGYDDLHLSPAYRDRNTAAYGIIEHTATDTSRTSAGELEAWASEMLQRHAEPVVSIEVEGLELVQATGESLDRLTLGRMCRVPLPEFGTTITERITALTYQDKLHQPEVVRITLANNIEDVTRIIADNIKATSRGGRGAVRTSKEDHAWFEDTNDHVAMVAEGIVGVDAEGNPNWTLLSEIIVDGTGIHQNVVEVQNGLTLAETHIEQNSRAITLEAKRASEAEGELSSQLTVTAEAITAEVKRASDAEGELSGRLDVTAEAITAEVTRASTAEGELSGRITVTAEAVTTEVERAKGEENSLSGRITTEAGKISLVVEETSGGNVIKAASIVTAINGTGSSVAISADHVSITGDTKLSGALTVSDGSLVVKKSAVFQGNVTLQDANGILEAKNYVVKSGGHVRFTGTGAGEYYDLTPSNIQGFIKSASVSGNVLTLTPVYGNAITFSKATSLSGAWSGGDFTATAKQNNVTVGTVVTKLQDIELSGDVGLSGTYVSQTAKVMYGEDDDEQFTPTGYQETLYINVASKLQQGSASSAGTYNPASEYVGFSSFTVSGVGGGDKTRFGSNQGSYYIEAYDSSTGTGVSGSSVQYTLKAGYTAGSGILVDVCDTGGTKIANTASCPIWMAISSGPVNDQGLMQYDTYYGIASGNTILATWKTPPDNSMSHNASITQVLDEDAGGSGSSPFYGKLYAKDGSSYVAITGSDRYWYFSGSNIGSRTVYWN